MKLTDLNFDMLCKIPVFRDIEKSDIEKMLVCMNSTIREYGKEQYIFTSENWSGKVGIVLSGSVNIIKEDFWGNRAIITKTQQGEMFAEAFACAHISHPPVNVVTAQPCKILFIDYQRIVTTCSQGCTFHNKLIHNMMSVLANKNLMLTQKIEHLTMRSTREKLLSYLSSCALKNNSNQFSIPFNRQELADYLSVDRSAMSNELCKLRDDGVLEFKKNAFLLKQYN